MEKYYCPQRQVFCKSQKGDTNYELIPSMRFESNKNNLHFIDERRPTVNELSNQKGVVQKASGWKLFHMAAQIEDLVGVLF